MKPEPVVINSSDYWFKVVEMLQQNWALIDSKAGSSSCVVYFMHDMSGIFDMLQFDSVRDAQRALLRNGFARYEADKKAQNFIKPPRPPFYYEEHPNGPIYSSGRYWK